jgi:hypothetical protein
MSRNDEFENGRGSNPLPEIRRTNPIKETGALPNCINCKGVLHNGFYGDYNYCDDCMSDLETRSEGNK